MYIQVYIHVYWLDTAEIACFVYSTRRGVWSYSN